MPLSLWLGTKEHTDDDVRWREVREDKKQIGWYVSTNASRLFAIAIGLMTMRAALAAADGSEQWSQSARRPSAAPESPTGLEEIVVTARKREESSQNVPVVASVITQHAIERTQIDDLYAVANRVPGLLLGNAVHSTGTQATLRGIGKVATNASMDESVTLDIDGMPLSQGLAYGLGMFEVAQVAGLEGPQGKNSTVGVISLHSADPTNEFESIVRSGYEEEVSDKQVDAYGIWSHQ